VFDGEKPNVDVNFNGDGNVNSAASLYQDRGRVIFSVNFSYLNILTLLRQASSSCFNVLFTIIVLQQWVTLGIFSNNICKKMISMLYFFGTYFEYLNINTPGLFNFQ
jgi:hypothetical protein